MYGSKRGGVHGSPSALLGWHSFFPSASHQLATHWSRVVVPARVSTHGSPATGNAAHFPLSESQEYPKPQTAAAPQLAPNPTYGTHEPGEPLHTYPGSHPESPLQGPLVFNSLQVSVAPVVSQ